MFTLSDAVKSAKSRYGKAHSADGYIYIYAPAHPNTQKGGKIAQHRYNMSCYLGRPLTEDEDVHHKNGIRWDNTKDNLELICHHFSGQRVSDIVNFCSKYSESTYFIR